MRYFKSLKKWVDDTATPNIQYYEGQYIDENYGSHREWGDYDKYPGWFIEITEQEYLNSKDYELY